MTLLILLLAAFSGATFHFGFRKCLGGGGRTSVFLMLQCFFATAIMLFLNSSQGHFLPLDIPTLNLGAAEGGLYVVMMWMLGKAFQRGPPGLTVATMNSAAIVPAILMAILFGSSFGHTYTLWNGVGSFLVVVGLFWAAFGTSSFTASKAGWAICAALAFAFHSLFLTVYQWRALLLQDLDLPYFSFSLSPEHAGWFLPIIFFTAGIIQLVLYFFTDGTKISAREVLWSAVGGLGNAFCNFALVRASEVATGAERAMLFPISGTVSILLCSLWGKWLYKEQINWKGNALCLGGIVLGTM